jgi:hypothetical protein
MKLINLVTLLLLAVVSAKASEQTVESATTRVNRKGLQFFRHFGSELNRNKINRVLECNYEDPDTAQYCPPIKKASSHAYVQDGQQAQQE